MKRTPILVGLSFSISLPALVACGGGGAATAEPEPAPVSTGGEATLEGEQVAMRTTTPVPVPQPATPREELGQPLQDLWTRTEEIVADRPPEPPADASEVAIEAWAEDPFAPWVAERRDAIQEAEPFVEAIGDDAVQRSVAAALFGYMYEDTAAGIRGAPVPSELAEDAELLEVYVGTLDEALQPFAVRALESYVYCATTFASLGAEEWNEWTMYCTERARDVADVFGLAEAAAPAEAEAASEAEAPAEDEAAP